MLSNDVAWKDYRQALRDLPKHVDITNPIYPSKPRDYVPKELQEEYEKFVKDVPKELQEEYEKFLKEHENNILKPRDLKDVPKEYQEEYEKFLKDSTSLSVKVQSNGGDKNNNQLG